MKSTGETTRLTQPAITCRAMTDRIAYSVPEAARAIGIAERSVWRLIAAGEFATLRVGGRTLIGRDDLVAFLDAQRVTASA